MKYYIYSEIKIPYQMNMNPRGHILCNPQQLQIGNQLQLELRELELKLFASFKNNCSLFAE